MKPVILILVVAILAVTVISCGQETTLSVSPNSLPHGGGTVKVTYKTSGYLAGAQFELKCNPTQSGFPIDWTGDMGQTIDVTITTTTTFTITSGSGGPMITSKTVSVP